MLLEQSSAHSFTYCLCLLSCCCVRVKLLRQKLYGCKVSNIYYLAHYWKSLSTPVLDQ